MSSEDGRDEVTPTSHKESTDDAAAHESATDAGGSERAMNVDEPVCDLCGAPMIDRHCKLVCGQCGYMRDCSDP